MERNKLGNKYKMIYKIVCLGTQHVGKTSWLVKVSTGKFQQQIQPTHGADFISFKAFINGQIWKLQVWDTAGQERFNSINQAYFSGSHGALLVISVSENLQQNLQKIKNLVYSYQQKCPECPVFLIFNKIDLLCQQEFETINKQNLNSIMSIKSIKKVFYISAKIGSLRQVQAPLKQLCSYISESYSSLIHAVQVQSYISTINNQQVNIHHKQSIKLTKNSLQNIKIQRKKEKCCR